MTTDHAATILETLDRHANVRIDYMPTGRAGTIQQLVYLCSCGDELGPATSKGAAHRAHIADALADTLHAPTEPNRCSCGNDFDGDNLCMVSACQWEGVERPAPAEPEHADRVALTDAQRGLVGMVLNHYSVASTAESRAAGRLAAIAAIERIVTDARPVDGLRARIGSAVDRISDLYPSGTPPFSDYERGKRDAYQNAQAALRSVIDATTTAQIGAGQ